MLCTHGNHGSNSERNKKQSLVAGLISNNSWHVDVGLEILVNCDKKRNIGCRKEVVNMPLLCNGM
jgi:hypothetical protein